MNKKIVVMAVSLLVASAGFAAGVLTDSASNVGAAEVETESEESAVDTEISETLEILQTEEIVETEQIIVEESFYVIDETEIEETLIDESAEETYFTEEPEFTEESELTEETEETVTEFDVSSEVLNGIYVPNFNYGSDGHSVTYYDDDGVEITVLSDEGVTMNEEAWRMRGIDAYYGFEVSDDVFEQIIGAYDLICSGA